MDKPEKRLDLNSELGMTRRDMLRRGAIVGGTLLWVAPAIQSIAPKAFAQTLAPSSPGCAACYCWNTKGSGKLKHDTALHGGIHSGGLLNADDCAVYCLERAQDPDNNPFTHSIYCTGPAELPGRGEGRPGRHAPDDGPVLRQRSRGSRGRTPSTA